MFIIYYYPPHGHGYGIFKTYSEKYFIKELQRLTKNGWKYEIKSFMK